VTPIVWGSSEVEANGRLRRTTIYGAGPEMLRVFAMQVRVGRFLPPDDPEHARAFAVLGAKIKQELFGSDNALGARLRIGGEHFRVIGVMAPKGQFLGTDLDDTAYIPAVRAMALYNRSGLMTINLSYVEGLAPAKLADAAKGALKDRHGREDFTITTQEDMLKTLSKILNILTAAVGALGGISLLVGAVGIVTIMTIAVTERTGEIGLLVALGAGRETILALFLIEAVTLAALGGGVGLLLGSGLAILIGWILPALPVHTPWPFVALAEAASMVLGLLAGILPARRASRLKAVEALRAD
jgi:putative ABC transport system permease protein